MRRALVTGAASGLGRGLVTRLRERGDEVIALDVDAVVHDLGVPAFTCDVSDPDAVRGVRDEVGPVDLLFNNAGITGDDATRVIAVNLLGVVHGMDAFVPDMRARGAGHVVNTASLLGVRPSARRAAYSASKAGVIAYSLARRDDLATSGVRLSIVLPHVRSAIERGDPDGPEAAYVESGLDPLDAADQVLAGVDAGALWIAACADPEGVLEQVRHLPQ